MIKGLGLTELLVALTIGLGIAAVMVATATETARNSKRVISGQDRLEAIFHTVDTLKADLSKCGMRLQEAAGLLTIFEPQDNGFSLKYGVTDDTLQAAAVRGATGLAVAAAELFSKDKPVLIFDPEAGTWAVHDVSGVQANWLSLKEPLRLDFAAGCPVVLLKQVEYRYFPREKVLKRKSDSGKFQPLLEEVSDFYSKFFADSKSLLYRIEVNRKEQIRGYVFMLNMVKP